MIQGFHVTDLFELISLSLHLQITESGGKNIEVNVTMTWEECGLLQLARRSCNWCYCSQNRNPRKETWLKHKYFNFGLPFFSYLLFDVYASRDLFFFFFFSGFWLDIFWLGHYWWIIWYLWKYSLISYSKEWTQIHMRLSNIQKKNA